MSSAASAGALGIYAHVPFCQARCSYCAFYTLADRGDADRGQFAAALGSACERLAVQGQPPLFPPLGGRRVDSIYFGGGTPSLLAPDDLVALVDRLRHRFDLTSDVEITLEANPETVNPDAARAWIAAGINRVSLGAQTFDAAVLRHLGREHGPEMIGRAVGMLRGAGCANLSLDLIAGVNPAGLEADLEQACALAPDHLSVYLLELTADEVGGRTPLAAQAARGTWRPPDEDWFADAYPRIVRRLAAAGLRRYEISNFARPGRTCRHNLKYWRCEEVLGVGPAAHTLLGGRRFATRPDLASWLVSVARDGTAALVEDREIDPPAEALILGLRLDDGVSWAEVEERAGMPPRRAQRRAIDAFGAQGLLRRSGDRLQLTMRGVLLSNEVFERLLD